MFIADCISDFTLSYGLPLSLFLAGLVGGFTHCAGMCSPFVLAQVGGDVSLKKPNGALLLPYHMGRMTTYVALAFLLSSVLNLAFLFSGLREVIVVPVLMLAGALFLVSAFPSLSAVFPWAVKFQITKPFKGISAMIGKLMTSPEAPKKYMLGVLLGFMPCGLVVSALMAASTASTPLIGAASMGAFALGTMPALVLIGLGGGAVKGKFPNFSKRFSQGAMALSAVWLFLLAGMLVF